MSPLRFRLATVALCSALAWSPLIAAAPATVTIAAASNLTFVLPPLQAAFAADHPAIELNFALGATGNLVAQIERGAPFDVFLAADVASPAALVNRGRAVADSLFIFVRGQLVWWTLRPIAVDSPFPALLADPALRRIAIAQPDHAPYGSAARQVLRHLNLWTALEPKIVVGENISQTAQFIASGNADGGFVALSLVLAPRLAGRGHWRVVPSAWHEPLDQAAVLTRHGADQPAALVFLNWLQGPTARDVLTRAGYEVPTAAGVDVAGLADPGSAPPRP